MIEISHLTKKFGDHVAVDDISFRIQKGKIYGFLGPNGAGKTTTMNMITGYISATDGDITINGYDIFEDPELAKKSIGYLPELPPLYMDMTPYEYLKFAAELKKIDKRQRGPMIAEIMERTKIVDVKDRLIKNLSKGYRQRVGVAQAMLGYPEVIILDEPTVGLDPRQITEIRDLIKDLGKDHTVILSSHILAEVSAICDEVLIIHRGKLIASDTPEKLTRKLQRNTNTNVSMTVLGERARIEEVLDGEPQVRRYEMKPSASEKDGFDIEISGDEAESLRTKLFEAFAAAHCPIVKLQLSEVSLEDAFLALIGKRDEALAKEEEETMRMEKEIEEEEEAKQRRRMEKMERKKKKTRKEAASDAEAADEKAQADEKEEEA